MQYKKLLLFCLINFNVFLYSKFCFVFVHIGNSVPSYMFESIKQVRLFNENSSIYIVVNKSNIAEIKLNLKHLENVVWVTSEEMNQSESHKKYLNKTANSDFWRYTTERFFFIEELMQMFNLKNVFHLENDNLIYLDIKQFINIFKRNYDGIAATFDNDNRCIPGFVYIKNLKSISKLNEFISENYNDTDMAILAKFRNSHENIIQNLPIIPDSYKNFFELISTAGYHTNYIERYSKNFDKFNSIFDAAALGQFLGGIHYHEKNTIGFINESCLFNPKNFDFVWKLDNKNRKVPFAKFKNQIFKINNLHIHSKNLAAFSSLHNK